MEQAKDEQISDFIRDKYVSDLPLETALDRLLIFVPDTKAPQDLTL